MKSESFERIRYVHEMMFPRIKRFQGKITEEQLLRIWNRRTIEEVYKDMPKEEIEFVEEWLRNGGGKEFLINCLLNLLLCSLSLSLSLFISLNKHSKFFIFS